MRPTFESLTHQRNFETTGFVVLPGLLSPDDVAMLTACWKQHEAAHQDDFSATILSADRATRAMIHEVVAGIWSDKLRKILLDYDVILGSFAVKLPGTQHSNVGLHQDITFVDEERAAGLSLWAPLVNTNEYNGGLAIVPGSQQVNSNPREPSSLAYRDLVDLVETELLIPLPLRAGDALLMDNRLIHGSPANMSRSPRPVAAGVAVPRGEPVLIYHRDQENAPFLLEKYVVPRDFLLRHTIGERPTEGELTQVIPRVVTPHSRATLIDALRPQH